MSNPTPTPRPRKAAQRPKKPYPEFPLYPHPSGKWAKKIRGSLHYFGSWAKRVGGKLQRVEGDGWEEALRLYKEQADDLHAGRTPRVGGDGLLVKDLCNRFLTAKLRKLEAGELGRRMFEEYREITDLLVAAFGGNRPVEDLAAEDFEALRAKMARRWGPVRLGNAVIRVKSVFKYATDNGLTDKAIRYESEFRKPGKATLRRHRAEGGARMLEAEDVRRLLGCPPWAPLANVQMQAMILLGVNCGFGNADLAGLRLSHLDLERDWVNFPRPKTGIERRCPLWPETVAALRAAIAERPTPRDYPDCGLVFLTERGTALVRVTEKSRTDNISIAFNNLLKSAGLYRERVGFYTLRHVHRTAADGARDSVACDLIMGHADDSMAGHYRERIEDDRLRAVTDVVRAWLWPRHGKAAGT